MGSIHNRRSKRLPYRKRVRFGTKKPEYTGHTLNFSYHGIVIESSTILKSGSSIVLEIIDKISSGNGADKSAIAVGKVVWTNRDLGVSPRGKMGVEFSKTSRHFKEIYRSRTEN